MTSTIKAEGNVWVVVGGWDYEGTTPLAVFVNKEDAKQYIKERSTKSCSRYYDYYDYESIPFHPSKAKEGD